MIFDPYNPPTIFDVRYRLFRPQMDLAFILLAFGIIMALIFLFTKDVGLRRSILRIAWILIGLSFFIFTWVLLQKVMM